MAFLAKGLIAAVSTVSVLTLSSEPEKVRHSGDASFLLTTGAQSIILSLDATMMAGDCNYHCRRCGSPPNEGHDIVVHYSTNNHQASHLESCNPGSCDSHTCGGGDDDDLLIGALWTQLRDANAVEVEQLLAAHASVLELDSARKAVHFRCPKGKLIASLPLSVGQWPVTE